MLAAPLSAISRLRSRSPVEFSERSVRSEEWMTEVFRPEESKSEDLRIQAIPSEHRDIDLLPQQLRSSQRRSEHIIPRQLSGGMTRARGGGGSSSSEGSQGPSSSSLGAGRPVKQTPPAATQPAPKLTPKKPTSVPPYHKPELPPISPLAPNSGLKPTDSKSGAGPPIGPEVGPTRRPVKLPKPPKISGYNPHSQSPYIPPNDSDRGHSKHATSDKLGGCNVRCRNALLGTFSGLALLGLLGLIIFCIFRRKRGCRRGDPEQARKSKPRSYPNGRRWWKQGDSDPRLSEDGMELTTHRARGVSFSMFHKGPEEPQMNSSRRSTGSYDRGVSPVSAESPRHSVERSMTPYPMDRIVSLDRPEGHDREWSTISYREEMLGPSNTPQMHSQERRTSLDGERELTPTGTDRSNESIRTARSISSCESCILQRARMHTQVQSTISSAVRRPISIDSDESDDEDFIPRIAQRARVVSHPPVIHTIIGMQGFRAGECELQRRNARRNSNWPDLGDSRHQSLQSGSSATFVIGADSDEEDSDDTCTVTDNGDAGAAKDDEPSRGRTRQRSSFVGTTMQGQQA